LASPVVTLDHQPIRALEVRPAAARLSGQALVVPRTHPGWTMQYGRAWRPGQPGRSHDGSGAQGTPGRAKEGWNKSTRHPYRVTVDRLPAYSPAVLRLGGQGPND
jgi:hypothetical protein